MKCPKCNRKGEIIKYDINGFSYYVVFFYCWKCEEVYSNGWRK